MNIGQLLRSVMGDLHVSDAKSLELKIGQVVRGVILQVMSEQEALVNIGGVQVRARLETPMAQGQSTLLQVQPESTGGQVVLKPLEASVVQIAERSMPELLKGFELKDSPGNRRAVQELHQGQAPLSKETLRAYADVRAAVPEGVEEGHWREAALLAVKRGLPVTTETVGALHRTLFGRPLDQSLRAFAALTAEALSAEGGAQEMPPTVRALVGQIRQLAESLPNLPAQPAEAPARAAAQPGRAAAGEAAAPVQARGATGGGAPAAAERGAAAAGGSAPGAQGAADAADAGEAAPAAGRGAAPAGRSPAEGAAQAPVAAAGGAAAARAQAQQEPAEWIGRLLKALGVEHEQQLARHLTRGGDELPPLAERSDGRDNAPSAPGTAAPQPADVEAAKTADTLKSLLLQLSAADDAPSALREGAQQLVQQITGQQLLLTPDRASMFAHMTLMLPLHNGDGSQTAAVHIQSRKGQRGELDATNCRLLFDLNMRTLGTTLVDVQVTDKIVSLRVHNDFPVIGELLERHREDIKSGLEKIGYQFLSLKVLPYPEPSAPSSPGASESLGEQGTSAVTRAASLYHAKPYKGVDLRV